MNLLSELRIRTPEGVIFAYRLAGPVSRCLAWALDAVVVYVLFLALDKALRAVGLFITGGASGAVVISLLFMAYAGVLEWRWRGQTLGKRVLRLRVIDSGGLRLEFTQLLIRNLLRAVDSMPAFYFIGGLSVLLSRHGQRLGDLAAGTIVVHIPLRTEPNLEQVLGGKFNSLRQSPHLAARLRQRVSPEQAQLALRALLRRDAFDSGARVALFHELAEYFKEQVKFPPEDTESLPDEQYVRNVVDILYRARAESTPALVPVDAGS